MLCRTKLNEVQFYLDRSKDSLLATLRSVLTNPRLSDEDRMLLLRMMGDHHRQVFELIDSRIQEGERKGTAMAKAQLLSAQEAKQ